MSNTPNGTRPTDALPLPVAGPTAAETPAATMPPGSFPLTPLGVLPSGGPSSAPNALSLLKALRRRWLLASTLGFVVAAATAAAIWFFLPPGSHTAYIRLYMPIKPEGILARPEGGMGDFQSFQRTQMTLMRSRLVLNAALNDPKVKQLNLSAETKSIKPEEWLEKEVRVDLTDGPELPRVSMTGDDPEKLQVLVTAVVKAYLDELDQKHANRQQKRLELLNKVSENYQRNLKRIQDERSTLVKSIGSSKDTVIALRQQLAVQQLSQAQQELLKLGSEMRKSKLELQQLVAKGGAPVEISEKAIDEVIEKKLAKEIAERKELEKHLKTDLDALTNPNAPNPLITELRANIEAKKKAIAGQREELRPEVKARLQELALNDANARVLLLREQVKFDEQFEALLKKEIEHLEGGAQVLNGDALNLEETQAKYEQAKAGVARVMAAIDNQNVEAPAPPRVSMFDDQVVLVSPDESTRRLKAAGMGAAGALGAVLLLVSFLEFRARRLDSAEEVVRSLGLNLVGSLPAAPRRFGGRLVSSGAAAADWQHLLAESVDSARTMLLRAAATSGIRVVMITSASSGEGKTSLATHLAASLARAGHKTLLIDGDLRKPATHCIFNLPLTPGLSEFLRGQVDLAQTVRPTHAPGLWLLPAGTYDEGAIQLLAGGAIQGLLGRLKQEYEFIVMDSCPVLAAADSLILAQHVDGVLISLLHEVSRLPKVYAACQRLNMLGAPMLGVVINGTRDNDHDYGPYIPKTKTT